MSSLFIGVDKKDVDAISFLRKTTVWNIVISWAIVGQQTDASQSFGSGLTYSFRYFLLKYFDIATPEDDPDNWRSKQQEAKEAEEKSIADQIIKSFDEKLRTYLSAHQDMKDEVEAFISKYAKKGIGCSLHHLQKGRDGEPLGGFTRAEDEFDDGEEDFLS